MATLILMDSRIRIGQTWEPLKETRRRCCKESVGRYDPESKDLWSLDPRSSPPRSSPPLFSPVASSFFVGLSRGYVSSCPVLWILFNCFIVVLSPPFPFSPSCFFLQQSFPRNVLDSLGRLAKKRPRISRIGNYVGHWLFLNNLYRYIRTFSIIAKHVFLSYLNLTCFKNILYPAWR